MRCRDAGQRGGRIGGHVIPRLKRKTWGRVSQVVRALLPPLGVVLILLRTVYWAGSIKAASDVTVILARCSWILGSCISATSWLSKGDRPLDKRHRHKMLAIDVRHGALADNAHRIGWDFDQNAADVLGHKIVLLAQCQERVERRLGIGKRQGCHQFLALAPFVERHAELVCHAIGGGLALVGVAIGLREANLWTGRKDALSDQAAWETKEL
jgi:hypothetical protein